MSTFRSERWNFLRQSKQGPVSVHSEIGQRLEHDAHGTPQKSIYSSLPEEKKRVNFPHEMTNTACCERGTNILYLKGDSGSSLSFPFPIVSWLSLTGQSVS